ncbi:MAG: TIGR03960 family B12-binding radical SAM protein [Myxococcales bacterium]|nr:TIGR03960 family B12-binding radical SAM protein [Myxococcales bacterium]MBK7194333.1 TIGR03960 family B12-binding radical SAM protein [Myxococcales bacterium]
MRHVYADFIDQVLKPARYLGGEYQSVHKDWATVEATVCLAFPDVYDIGMSHLGTKILYSLLNRDPRIACERAFAPWTDMEGELRARGLPLCALESQRPLADFDVVGVSLQYELTFTNVLTLLDLGGVGLHAADRAADAPLVLVGGPVATHPEPLAPFIDAAFVGEGEEELPALVVAWAALRREIRAGARTRADALAELAATFPLYVPALYDAVVDEATGMTVVGAPRDPRVPARVRRAMVRDLDAYPFPTDVPVPYAEAVFERASVEIARGCTEGCRFCQAGMIYRPVRERSPASIIASVVGGVEKAGYEETGLTCLSTADFSSISPLVSQLAATLRTRGVSMSVASLRAYGLPDEILDELAQTRITGLTFAPEAGTQRMRDVVNKNITEAHIEESTRKVFERGWHRVKLYFMIGLPTEEDDDVRGIVETGQRMLGVGKRMVGGGKAEVTVSVSSHVPKPHTPLQWCAQDTHAEIRRKQALLRMTVRDRQLRLKYHHGGVSWVEGLLARGDRRMAPVIEHAWRAGARFDGWEELFDEARWQAALDACGVDQAAYLGTRPVTARLPWDHIDVGLEDGFLLAEYRKALKGRASPPCGKVAGMLVHHTNLADAEPDRRKLVCYDCGVACDLSTMRADRLVALRDLGAAAPRAAARALPVIDGDAALDVSERGGGSPAEQGGGGASASGRREHERADRVRKNGFHGADAPYTSYRLRYTKLGRTAFLGHLDVARLLARSFRRAHLELAMSRGFSPKPRITYGPALSLGVPSFAEVFDVDLQHGDGPALTADDVVARLGAVCPEGLAIVDGVVLPPVQPGLGKLVTAADYVVAPAPDGVRFDEARLGRIAAAFLARDQAIVARGDKAIDVRALVAEVEVIAAPAATRLTAALGWDDGPLLRARVGISAAGSAKPIELAKAFGVYGPDDPRARHALVARLALVGLDAAVAAAGPGDQDAIVNAAQLASASGTTVSGQTTTSA